MPVSGKDTPTGSLPVSQKTSIGIPPRGFQKLAMRRKRGLIFAAIRLPIVERAILVEGAVVAE